MLLVPMATLNTFCYIVFWTLL